MNYVVMDTSNIVLWVLVCARNNYELRAFSFKKFIKVSSSICSLIRFAFYCD